MNVTFTPLIKPIIIRIILSIAMTNRWPRHQLDVKNAFLHGYLKETLFIEQPPCFANNEFPNHICQLNCGLYGLKQASLAWFELFSTLLLGLGLLSSKADSSLFVFKSSSDILLTLVYVDESLLLVQIVYKLNILFATRSRILL